MTTRSTDIRDAIVEILELTTVPGGGVDDEVWGADYPIGTVEELSEKILEILNQYSDNGII